MEGNAANLSKLKPLIPLDPENSTMVRVELLHVLGAVFITAYILIPLVLTKTPGGRYYHQTHLTGEEAQAKRL